MKACGVADGGTLHAMSRGCGGGVHRNKKQGKQNKDRQLGAA